MSRPGASRVIERAAHTRLSLNLTAMIDVVFLLLVFFLLATSFKVGEEVFRMDLPARGTAEPDPFLLLDEPLRIVVSSTRPGAAGLRIQLSDPFPPVPHPDALYRFLNERRVGPNRLTGLFAPAHPIVIEPTATARWEHVMEVFNAIARAEYTNISFASPGGDE